MTLTTVDSDNKDLIRQAAEIACSAHNGLTALYPWLPPRSAEDYVPRIEWMTREGRVYALSGGERLVAFLGWFPLENFRNAGPGALTPDWCLGVAPGTEPEPGCRMLRDLLRTALGDIRDRGIFIHAAGVPAHCSDWLEAFGLTGYGRIVLDAARPGTELAGELSCGEGSLTVRKARMEDAESLATLDRKLADHVAAPPVLMPDTRGSTAAEWDEWLADPDTVTLVAENESGALAGFIKAAEPQFDVTYTVHDPSTLAICGLWVEPDLRGSGIASRLLAALNREGLSRGKTMVSVDCETHNPEACGFWTRYFRPVCWSFERRF